MEMILGSAKRQFRLFVGPFFLRTIVMAKKNTSHQPKKTKSKATGRNGSPNSQAAREFAKVIRDLSPTRIPGKLFGER
jgi:hypothetical protein